MKGKILNKMMMVALVICSMFLISACSWQKDVNIKTIEINEETIPSIIRVGEFDEAGIELIITYEDNSTEEIAVTSEMIPQEYLTCLETPGIYEIEIFFKGEKAILNITIVEAATYMVEFYNGKEQLIERQFVKSGEDAVAPDASAYTMYGYEFVGWDRLFTDVAEDIKVYGVYSKLSTEDMNALVHEKMVNALTYMYSHDYVMTSNDDGAQLNYHFNEAEQQGESQVVYYLENKLDFVQMSSKDEMVNFEFDEVNNTWEKYSDDLTDENLSEEEKKTAVMFGGEMIANLFKEETVYTYSYILAENRNIYTVEASYSTYNEAGELVFIDKIQFVFDDEKILSFKWGESESSDVFEYDMEMLVEYKTQEFETIENQDLFLLIYNEARTNVLAQTTLHIEEEEDAGDGYYTSETHVFNNKVYGVSTYWNGSETWIQKEGDEWFHYYIYQAELETEKIYYKDNYSEYISNDSVMEYVIDERIPIFDEELISQIESFECTFENDVTKLTLSIMDEEYLIYVTFYIEDGLVTKMEEYMPGEPLCTMIFSYNPEDVEMVELPTDVEWIEN